MTQSSQKLKDTDLEIPAPEYIVFRNQLAGPTIRFFAAFFDHFLLILLILIVGVVGLLIGGSQIALGRKLLGDLFLFIVALFTFILFWLYFVLQEWLMRGRTLGKLVLGLRVVSLDGTALDIGQIILRNLIRIADMVPFLLLSPGAILGIFFINFLVPSYLVGMLGLFVDRRAFRRLGDRVAGTIVVRDNRRFSMQVSIYEHERITALSQELRLKHFPSPVLTQALNDFVDRFRRLHPARADEIALRVEAELREIFGARDLECRPVELILAAHTFLYRMTREESSGLELDHVGLAGAAPDRPAGAPGTLSGGVPTRGGSGQ